MTPRSRNLVSVIACMALVKVVASCRSEAIPSEPGPSSPLTACPDGAPGPTMVFIPTPEGNYCIDSTEVTQSQYALFLATKPQKTDHTDEWCKSHNISYEPRYQDDTGGDCQPAAIDLKTKGDWPMVCVDWCDAHAYCAWAGKRLCGSRKGGAMSLSDDPASVQSQWTYACTNGGLSAFSTGDQASLSKCPLEGGSANQAECHGPQEPFAKILGMSGGVGEWEDACNDEPIARDCRVRSGYPLDPCSKLFQQSAANSSSTGNGFRCCADLTSVMLWVTPLCAGRTTTFARIVVP